MPAKELTVLFFGDIVGKPGRRALAAVLPELKKEFRPDVTIANAENVAHGVGVTRKTLQECRDAGVDFFTSGNHIWKKPEVYEIFKDLGYPLLRPENFGDVPGRGHHTILLGETQLLVVNLSGQVFLEDEYRNPFQELDRILGEYQPQTLGGIIVDFHAEATSEKVAFGWYADGRVSAVLGTHTHVPTADERILPGGTGYLTDVGMVGLADSVIGVNKDVIIKKFLNPGEPGHHDIADHGHCTVNAVLLRIDPKTRKTVSIARIHKEITT